jgi:hypothetical protein
MNGGLMVNTKCSVNGMPFPGEDDSPTLYHFPFHDWESPFYDRQWDRYSDDSRTSYELLYTISEKDPSFGSGNLCIQ